MALLELCDYEKIESQIICFKNDSSLDIVKGMILGRIEKEDFRVESIIESMIEHNSNIFAELATNLVDSGCIDWEDYNDRCDAIETISDSMIYDYLGHDPFTVLENILYNTVKYHDIPLIMDYDSFGEMDVLLVRTSKSAKYTNLFVVDNDTEFHINHCQTIMFNLDDVKEEGGCWHYGLGNVLIIEEAHSREHGRLEGSGCKMIN